MPKDETKTKVVFSLNECNFSFTYDLKIISPGLFSNPKFFYINNFKANIIIAIVV